MKKFICGFLLGAIIFCNIPIFASGSIVQVLFNDTKIIVNDNEIKFKENEKPVTINDRIYVPVKYIAEAFGTTANWNGNENAVSINYIPITTTGASINVDDLITIDQFYIYTQDGTVYTYKAEK